ncbi:MFS family permease [Kitasatospora sp. MAA19]|uniref:MFS transporter n=1 Tax=Kitasatospora sp. MAA19 TaxID=3035090 RepID=UPI0024747F48|nr:MFS transporter [Kitasatospora sp. MAA19]MDH6704661.1 MFS family permease [Kitasatospora sp. MAA19]
MAGNSAAGNRTTVDEPRPITAANTAAEAEAETAAPPVPLRRNLRFQALWAGQAAASLGMRVGDTAFPLLVLALTGSSTAAGAFGAVQMITTLLLGIHGGAVADRLDRRRVLITSDAARLLAATSVPVAMAFDRLTLPHLLLVAAAIGATMAYSGPVRMLAVRSVVAPEQLAQALAQDEARLNGAALAGPPLAGFLYGLGGAVPFLGTTFTSLLALVSALVVRFPGRPADARPNHEPGTAEPQPESGGALAGFRLLAASPLLRSVLGVLLVVNLAGAALVLPVMVLLREQGTGSGGIGLALAGEAVGALAGAVLVSRLHRMAGPGALLLVVAWATVPVPLAPLLPGGAVTVFAGLFVVGLGLPSLRVMLDLLVFRQVPDELRGRVIAATMTLLTAGMPAGTLGSGLLLDHFSPSVALAGITALLAVALLPATASRTLRRAVWPTAPAPSQA